MTPRTHISATARRAACLLLLVASMAEEGAPLSGQVAVALAEIGEDADDVLGQIEAHACDAETRSRAAAALIPQADAAATIRTCLSELGELASEMAQISGELQGG